MMCKGDSWKLKFCEDVMKLYLEGEVYENNRDCPSVLCLCVGPVWADYNSVPPNVPMANIGSILVCFALF